MIFLGRVQECWSNGAQSKADLSRKVVALPFCPLCSPLLLLFLSTGLALLVLWCCPVYSLWPGQEGWEGSGWEAGADWRVGGGLSRHRAPLFASPTRQLVWDFWEGFFPLSFFFTLEE